MKKVLLVVLSLVLVAALSVGLTLAYLTSHDEVVNTFTVGKVGITLDEADVDEYGVAIEGAARVKINEYKLIPGHTYVKDPTVTVTGGSEDCYVRALVTVTYNDAADAALKANGGANAWFNGYFNPVVWVLNGTGEFDNLTGDTMSVTYELRYKGNGTNGEVLSSATDQTLPAVFNGFKVPSGITETELPNLAGMTINVTAHAIQADGFNGDVDKAWRAFDAQNPAAQND